MRKQAPISVRKIILLTINLASTILTLLTGLRENPVIVFASGRYDHMRARLMGGTINYENLRDDTLTTHMLPDLKVVGESYRLISSPRRSPENLDEDRSTCMYVNSLNTSMMGLYYDDFWGTGPRRAQIFMHSISAPKCKIMNLKPAWYEEVCVAGQGGGNATLCHEYILEHFDEIHYDYTTQVGQAGGFGLIGVPLLKCLGRPMQNFTYYTDLIVEQQYWSGGSYHVEIQSSKCLAVPLARDTEWRWSLFQVNRTDYAADVVTAIDGSGWFVLVITTLYGIVTIFLIVHGMLAGILRMRAVKYLPAADRFTKEWRLLKFVFPFMSAARTVTENANHIITFKGSVFMASDVWMNHWLYLMLSILDAIASIRAMYMVLEMGTWMLTMKLNFENFIFMCSALTRITWLLCGVHTVLRYLLKLAVNSVRSLKIFRTATLDRCEWFIDAWALFMSYKMYSLLLCIYFAISLQMRGTTSFMKEARPGGRAVYGGEPDITQFWGNEIMCDAITILAIILGIGLVFSILLLQTKYRHITTNGVIRLLQERYIVVGWDVFVTIEALGIDPFHPELVGTDGICRTNCSLGAILQQLYTSGLSGYVTLASDYLFLENGFSQEPVKLRYPVKRAMALRLCEPQRYSNVSGKTGDESVAASTVRKDMHDDAKMVSSAVLRSQPNKSLFERRLKIVSEGAFGKILFIDEDNPGRLVKSTTSSLMEFEVQEALTTMSILDIKPLLGNDKKLRIR